MRDGHMEHARRARRLVAGADPHNGSEELLTQVAAQAAADLTTEQQRALADVVADLEEVASSALLEDVRAELQGWRSAIGKPAEREPILQSAGNAAVTASSAASQLSAAANTVLAR